MKLEVRSLAPQLLDDYLDYFDNTAFADNADWAGCYCYFYLADHSSVDWDSRSAAENRRSVTELISRGEMYGYLAYVDGEVGGWCHAGPKTYFSALVQDEDPADPDTPTTGSIVCFNVAPGRRRLGIATGLLDAASRGLADLGMTIVEAYPRGEASTDAGHYHGPLQMYLRAGFVVHREQSDYLVVRKNLGAAGERWLPDEDSNLG